MQNNLNLLVLGCGNMGAALAAGYAEAYQAAQILALAGRQHCPDQVSGVDAQGEQHVQTRSN
ncbi:hypothetical protein KI614_09765 [Dechloromonas denitrificans]|nr:hypothetical protein KI614_09765 [Dechloromonas denitrificans]